MACTVRSADQEGDDALLARVLRAAPIDPSSDLAKLEPSLALAIFHVYLALADQEPVGCVMSTREKQAIIHSLVVVPAARGKGVGADILRVAVRHLVENHKPACIWTAVDPKRPGSAERFEELGFEQDPHLVKGHVLLRYQVASDLTLTVA